MVVSLAEQVENKGFVDIFVDNWATITTFFNDNLTIFVVYSFKWNFLDGGRYGRCKENSICFFRQEEEFQRYWDKQIIVF